ncbi:MAG: hypothetical protein JWN50_181 [Parcubacteria group bacterium]|nr:hypothetical protein [Parcubacteria group bacterium]
MKTSLTVLIALIIIAGGYLLFTHRGNTTGFVPVTVTTGGSTPAPGTTGTSASSTSGTVSTADIVITAPRSGQAVTSPLTVTGQARGNWFFEASAPIFLEDENGTSIARSVINAQGDWMTTNFVPFSGTLTFNATSVGTSTKGFIVFMNDNPSGNPTLQKSLSVPVTFSH